MGVGRILGYIGRHWFTQKGVRFSGSAILNGWPILSVKRRGQIVIGNNAVLTSWSKYTALGVAHPVILRALTEQARVTIGDNVGLSGTTICAAEEITIGNDCLVGANVMIVDTDFHPIEPQDRRSEPLSAAKSRPVHIADNVFIGGHSLILKGVTIGENSVIGAGSVVTRDIPANSIAAGNPCKVIMPIKRPSRDL